ncbi:MAG: hypothetical protein ACP5KJ_04300, partial [Candidatus Micrarchaeia archaeon]
SNKEQTLFALASLLGQKLYGWEANVAARYIGEAMGAKVVEVYEKSEENKENKEKTIYVGSELSFNNLGFAKEIRLYYVAAKKVEEVSEKVFKLVQQIAGAGYRKGKFEIEGAGASGWIDGKFLKLWYWDIFNNPNLKLTLTTSFGKFEWLKLGEEDSVKKAWTVGLGAVGQFGKLSCAVIPVSVSYMEDLKDGKKVTSYE